MCIEYSIIIPHKNCLTLLERCISTIPKRDDVEIVIVDDNSDNFENPAILGHHVKVVRLTKQMSKGAGRARNIGMSYAQGRWLLFADADDYYTKNLNDFFDDYKNVISDVVYYNANIIDARQKYYRKQKNNYSEKLEAAKNNHELLNEIKYLHTMPWNKMVSRDFIHKYNIKFEEIIQGNDIFFSYQVGYYAQNILIDIRYLYTYFFQDNTITNRNWNTDKCICYIHNIYKTNEFKKFLGYNRWRVNPVKKLLKMMFKNYRISLSILYAYIYNYRMIKTTQDIYIKLLNGKKE